MPSLVNKEGVTTIPKGSRIAIGTQSEAVRLKIYFEYEIVYSPNKYRETDGTRQEADSMVRHMKAVPISVWIYVC